MSAPTAPSFARWRLLLVLAVTAACLGWVLWGIELDGLASALRDVRWELLPAVAAGLLVNHLLRVWRFKVLLRDLPFARSLAVCSVGFLAVNVVPLRMGELVRPYLLTFDDVPVGRSLAAVLVERLLDVAMMLVLLIIAVNIDLPARIEVAGIDVVRAGQQAAAVTLVAGVVVALGLWAVGARIADRLPVVGRVVSALSVTLAELLRDPGRGVLLVVQSVLVWSSTVVYVWITLACFPSLPQGLTVATVVWAAIISGIVALPTPGYFGAYEAFGLAALMLWDVDEQAARAFALFLHLAVLGFMIAVGGLFLIREGWSLRALVRESRAVARSELH